MSPRVKTFVPLLVGACLCVACGDDSGGEGTGGTTASVGSSGTGHAGGGAGDTTAAGDTVGTGTATSTGSGDGPSSSDSGTGAGSGSGGSGSSTTAGSQTSTGTGGSSSASGGGDPGNDNPDGHPTNGRLFYASDFETEIASQVVADPADLEMVWGADFGRDASGGWRAIPRPTGWEDNRGWNTSAGSIVPVDGARRVFFAFTIAASPSFVDELMLGSPRLGFKFLDVRQYLPDGSDVDGGNGLTRYLSFLAEPDDAPGQLKFSATAGGAGTFFHDDRVHLQPDWGALLPNGFTWVCFVLDEENTRMDLYLKRPGDAAVTKFLERDASDIVSNPPDPDEVLESNGRGFAVGERTVAGYWDAPGGIAGFAESADHWITLDDLSVADYWVGPPF